MPIRPARADDPVPPGLRHAWAGVPMVLDALVTDDASAGAILTTGTEPLTGLPQVTLAHTFGEKLAAVAAAAAPANGWVAADTQVPGFTASEYDLVIPLTPGPVNARVATRHDLPWIRELARASFPHSLQHLNAKDQQLALQRWSPERYEDLENILVTEAGYILTRDDHLEDLAILPEYWGKRRAHELVGSACARLHREGHQQAWACVSAANPRSWKVALRHGFRIVKTCWRQRFP